MIKVYFAAFLLMSNSWSMIGQSHEDTLGVNHAMLSYIEAFYEGDTSKLLSGVSEAATKYGYYLDKKENKYAGEAMSHQEMIDYCLKVKSRNRPPNPTWPKKVAILDVQDQTAAGKITAWWGTDYVLLEKNNEGWQIRMVLWQGPLK